MDKRVIISVLVVALVIASYLLISLIQTSPEDKVEPVIVVGEEQNHVGFLEVYFTDRYGVSVQSHLYYPSEYGASSPPVRQSGGYPALIFGCGYKGDNSIYEWVGRNLAGRGYVVFMPDFVNNTSPWAETKNGNINGLYCDTYGVNATIPSQYSGSNELWPDVWPWVHELIDSADFLINATTNNLNYDNGNTTIYLGGLVDKHRIGVMGHSTGGSMAIVASMVYKWFKLAVAYAPYDDVMEHLDWSPFPSDFIAYQYATPLLLLSGSRDVVTPPLLNSEQIYSHATTPKMLVRVLDGNHIYFCDSEDIFHENLSPPEYLPITHTPITINEQQNISLNVTTRFLDYYFYSNPTRTPYSINDDLDGDEITDINKSYKIGSIIKSLEVQVELDLSYSFYAEVVPFGIGWGNSTVNAWFYDILNNKLSSSPVSMQYQYGNYYEGLAGRFKCSISQKVNSVEIEARNTAGKIFKSEQKVILLR